MASLEKFIEEISAETFEELYKRRRQQHVYSQEKQKALDREIEFKREMAEAEERKQDRKIQVNYLTPKRRRGLKRKSFKQPKRNARKKLWRIPRTLIRET